MTVELAFVGAGQAARMHLANLRGIKEVVVKAVADTDEQKARRLADEWSAKAYRDGWDMLEAEEPDAVYICIPPAMHGSLEAQLADMAIPFFVEKPVHLDLDVAAQVREMVLDKGLITAAGYQFRYADAVEAAREYLSDRQITLVQGFYIAGVSEQSWWCKREMSGGQVVEQASHVFDLLRYIVGEVETVCAFATTGAMLDVAEYGLDDATVSALEFSDGAVGQVASSCVLKGGGDPRVGLRFDGRGYTLRLDPQQLAISDSRGRRDESFRAPETCWTARADRAFLKAVQTGDPADILSDYPDAVRTLDLVLAVARSVTTREPTSPVQMLLNAAH